MMTCTITNLVSISESSYQVWFA